MDGLWILTNSFPYHPGEEFLETEIEIWAELFDGNITLIPLKADGEPRPLPADVTVDRCLVDGARGAGFYRSPFVIFSPIFLRELLWLRYKGILSIATTKIAWRTAASCLSYYKVLQQKILSSGGNIICYSYWFDISAYATALLRPDGLVNRLVTRAHRFDVYEERRQSAYMPLKRQFVEDFSTIFAISEEGRSYLHVRYAIPKDRLKVARLGVIVDNSVTSPSPGNNLEILSVSFCVPVKRIDRIIKSISLAAQFLCEKGVSVSWTHVGDGELRSELVAEACLTLNHLDNVSFQFLGQLPNSDVMRYIKTNDIDVFINTSDSEGVPVAIMEAMSFGIPAIAPGIGGIPELVTKENGWLLSPSPNTAEIAEALCSFEHYKSTRTRNAAKEKILRDYNADENYRKFVRTVVGNDQTQ